MNKRGGLSKKDIAYIEKYRGKKAAEDIAAHLRRSVDQVRRQLAKAPPAELPVLHPADLPPTQAGTLESRPEWQLLKEQFDNDELAYYKLQYAKLIEQFGADDILPTEEDQINDYITIKILTQRCLREQLALKKDLDKVQAELDAEGTKPSPSKTEIRQLDSERNNLQQSLKLVSQRLEANQLRSAAMLKELMGSRNQRVKTVENSQKSFVGLIKELMSEKRRKVEGEQLAMVHRAMEKYKDRISRPHKYADGTIDQPLLTPETVSYGESSEIFEGEALAGGGQLSIDGE